MPKRAELIKTLRAYPELAGIEWKTIKKAYETLEAILSLAQNPIDQDALSPEPNIKLKVQSLELYKAAVRL